MSIKITSGASLQLMDNAIVQWNKTFGHKMENDIKDEALSILGMMHACRKLAMKKNEEYEEMKK